ncbi:9305_t:CDS:2 [Paraglomus occultum]|uniref:9305_t:CDS:1 n=1 Tax=Paraglomus occultum TaxID=144539 RepID=A0A9N9D942_9GLOM|nr:9305_t:CDS:2 [Paraglomus occultum]
MSKTRIHEYFVRESSDWDAVDFLNQCNVEPSNFEEKVDDYLKSLEFISNDKQQDSNRRQRAKSLLNKYRKATASVWGIGGFLGRLMFKASNIPSAGNPLGHRWLPRSSNGIRPDRQRVKSWLQEQLHKNRTGEETDRISVHLHNPTFADVASGIIHGGTINGGTIGTFGIEPSKKRSQEAWARFFC